MRRNKFILFCIVFLFLIFLPYFVRMVSPDNGYVFGGFLLNPIDGNSYLAKMEIGQNGRWGFTLPYTAEAGEGEALFLFYIILGHLSRLSGLDNIVVFHIARVISAFVLLFVLNRFIKLVFPKIETLSENALIMAALGSGLGWLFAISGYLFSDFWVAEAYPFLSTYSNPHFGLGMALTLLIFILFIQPTKKSGLVKIFIFGLLLSIIMPFGYVVAAVVILIYELQNLVMHKKLNFEKLLVFVPGGIFLVYQYYVTLTNPVLAGWNKQNITDAPPFFDLLVSFSPALLLAIFGVKDFLKSEKPARKLVLIWFIAGLVLIYLPFSLQRRFMFAFYIPVSLLAVKGIELIRIRFNWQKNYLFLFVLIFSLLTNVFLLTSGIMSRGGDTSKLYFDRQEMEVLQWIKANTDEGALILCSPDTGMLIPAYTGRRVIYGHPFETLNAENEKLAVTTYFESAESVEDQEEFLMEKEVDYILYGNREKLIGFPESIRDKKIVYQNEEVSLYDAHSQ